MSASNIKEYCRWHQGDLPCGECKKIVQGREVEEEILILRDYAKSAIRSLAGANSTSWVAERAMSIARHALSEEQRYRDERLKELSETQI